MSWQSTQRFKKSKRYKTCRDGRNYDRTTDCQYYPKNRVMCPDCGRRKLLFTTEDEARLYIKYNANYATDDQGHKPSRAYYCQSCCGWHVTHKAASGTYKQTPTEKLLKDYHQSLMSGVNREWYNVDAVLLKLTENAELELRDLLTFAVEELGVQLPFIVTEPIIELTHCNLYHSSQFNENYSKSVKLMLVLDKIIPNSSKTTIKVSAIGYNDDIIVFKAIFPQHLAIASEGSYIVIARNPAAIGIENNISEDRMTWVSLPETSVKVTIEKVAKNDKLMTDS